MTIDVIGSQEIHRPSRECALEFRKHERLKGDRRLIPSRVEQIKQAMLLGEFYDCTWQVVWVEELQRWLRLNGNHVTYVLGELGVPAPRNMTAKLLQYKATTRVEAGMIHRTIDVVDERSNSATVRAYIADHPRLHVLNPTVGTRLMEGISKSHYGAWRRNDKTGAARHKRVEVLDTYCDFCMDFHDLLKSGLKLNNKKYLVEASAGVIAGIHLISLKSRQWPAYFAMVRDGVGCQPAIKLRQYIDNGKRPENSKKVDDAKDMASKVIKTWNSYRRGEEVLQLRQYPGEAIETPLP